MSSIYASMSMKGSVWPEGFDCCGFGVFGATFFNLSMVTMMQGKRTTDYLVTKGNWMLWAQGELYTG